MTAIPSLETDRLLVRPLSLDEFVRVRRGLNGDSPAL
jgi:hypothetical protein